MNAFLRNTLNEEVYTDQPPNFKDLNHPIHVCRLKKGIYGLKQALRVWDNEFKGIVPSYGFQKSNHDSSLFFCLSSCTIIYFVVYFDDLLVMGNNHSDVSSFIHSISLRFRVEDLESLHYFLRVESLGSFLKINTSAASYYELT